MRASIFSGAYGRPCHPVTKETMIVLVPDAIGVTSLCVDLCTLKCRDQQKWPSNLINSVSHSGVTERSQGHDGHGAGKRNPGAMTPK